ncbi:aspartate 1-decarboxylase [Drosophila suzukii associated hytrosavirus 1]|nr:aspartate 1-decarboxylase [Drosophila suzukii associated hytrosavirus 1]
MYKHAHFSGMFCTRNSHCLLIQVNDRIIITYMKGVGLNFLVNEHNAYTLMS